MAGGRAKAGVSHESSICELARGRQNRERRMMIMKMQPTLEECKKLAREGNYGVIPVSTEILSDTSTPIEVLRILKKVSAHV